MSRIGKQPIAIPAGVTVECSRDKAVTVKGPLGQLERSIASRYIEAKIDGSTLTVDRTSDTKEARAQHGLYRSLLANMVKGVKDGFSRKLVVNGVGYKCSMADPKRLVMNIGFSHPVEVRAPEGVTITCNTPLEIEVKGIDKQAVGQVAAKIRSAKIVEPYHAYGIRYSDEVVIRKEGKKSGK